MCVIPFERSAEAFHGIEADAGHRASQHGARQVRTALGNICNRNATTGPLHVHQKPRAGCRLLGGTLEHRVVHASATACAVHVRWTADGASIFSVADGKQLAQTPYQVPTQQRFCCEN